MPSISNALLPPSEIRYSAHALLSFLFPRRVIPDAEIPAKKQIIGTPCFQLIEHLGAERASVEKFISQRFAESFGSRVEAFMPRLFTLRNQDGDICGAFGLRSANHKLFLEQYLDAPIEKIIASRTGSKVERRTVVEIGHFSGTFPGAVRAMIGLLTERLHRESFEWVSFTGTSSLRNAFCRLGLSPINIQAAEANRLPATQRAAWGTYYDHAPQVLVGNILEGYGALHSQNLPYVLPQRVSNT